MALRQLRLMGDEILSKESKEIKVLNERTLELIDDMFDTMYESGGCGLAAVQVGVLRRLFVVDVTGDSPMVFINPVILEKKGEQTGDEGCLSVPGKMGCVDIEMNEFEMEAEGFLARAICHEYDHLNGVLYVSKVDGDLKDIEDRAES